MNASKIAKVLFLTIFGVGILSGCGGDKSSPPVEKDTSPIAQPDEPVSDSELSVDRNSLEDGEVVSSPDGEKNGEVISSPGRAEDDTILILSKDAVTTLEPYQMVNIHPDGSVASHLWDTLTWLNDDLQIEPSLAESWQLINNFTWEFRLREGITFHNGEPLNAEAVRFSIERARSMPDSLETFATDVNLDQVEVVDDYTVRIVTNQPIANLPYHLAFLEILPPIYYSQTDPEQLAIAPVGSGPYRLVKSSQDEGVVLEAVPDYWKGTPARSQLVFRTVPLVQDRLDALAEGQATLVTDLPPMPIEQWNIPDSTLQPIESTQRMFIGIRAAPGSPLEDERVRQALNYGVNVEQIVDEWVNGYGKRYGSWVNPPANNPELTPWPYDPDQARELLAAAGYTEGFTTTLRTPVDVYYHDVDIAKTIAQQLGQINVTVKVEPINDWNVYMRELLTDDANNPVSLFLLGLNSRGDGLEDVKNLSSAFAFNPTRWENDTFEETLGRAVNTFNEHSRIGLLNEAQSIAYNRAPWIWLWRQYDFYGVSEGVDWTPRRDGLIYLYKPAPVSSESGP